MPIYGNDGVPEAGAYGGTAGLGGNVEMYPVDSSHMSEVGYDPDSMTLYVRFTNGALYEYYNVEPDLLEGLLYSTSKGSYLYQNIKAPGYSYSRVE